MAFANLAGLKTGPRAKQKEKRLRESVLNRAAVCDFICRGLWPLPKIINYFRVLHSRISRTSGISSSEMARLGSRVSCLAER